MKAIHRAACLPVLIVGVLAGCTSAPDAFWANLMQAYCDAFAICCTARGWHVHTIDCHQAAHGEDTSPESPPASSFNQAAADRCLAQAKVGFAGVCSGGLEFSPWTYVAENCPDVYGSGMPTGDDPTPPPSVGCSTDADCAWQSGLACDIDHVCHATVSRIGKPCVGFGTCSWDSFCDHSGACVPLVPDGGACTADTQCLHDGQCINGACQFTDTRFGNSCF